MTWKTFLLYNLLPAIGFHILIRPLWFSTNEIAESSAAIISLLFTSVILPISLLHNNYKFAIKSKSNSFFVFGCVVILCVWISAWFGFINWHDSTGNKPTDPGSEAIVDLERWTGTLITLLGYVAASYYLKKSRHKFDNGH